MKWRKATSQDMSRQPARWSRRIMLGTLLAVAVAVAVALGLGVVAGWARRSAAKHLEIGAIGAAERSLAWADWAQPGDYRTALMRAACFRRLGEIDAWRRALESAKQSGAPDALGQLERALGNLRWGQVESVSAGDYNGLVERGAAPRDAVHAVVHGLLAKGSRQTAQKLIDDWAASPADEAEVSFLRGVCWWSAGKLELAQAEFAKALEKQPAHDMARAGLARLFEDQHQFALALAHDAWLVRSAPNRESTRVDLARTLRKLGRVEDARQVLRRSVPGAEAPARVAIELAEIEFESGNYDEAQRWFDQVDLNGQHLPETLLAAACNDALSGHFARAEQLLDRVDDPRGLARRRDELQRRIGIDPGDIVAAQELARVLERLTARGQPSSDGPSGTQTSALFRQHCAACHGADGAGAGRAARYLDPRPRNLRSDKYRLVSTVNLVPTLEDIKRVIQEGIPGASMPAFAKLPQDQRQQLAAEVQQLYRERFRGEARELSAAGELLTMPAIGEATTQSIDRGRSVYLRSGCHQCHGDDGAADVAQAMFNDEGRLTTPRNLVRDRMKSGPQAESLYRRIRLGMPGTPHPASPSLDEVELIALVQYCQSLAKQPKQSLTNHERAMRAARQAHHRTLDQAAAPP